VRAVLRKVPVLVAVVLVVGSAHPFAGKNDDRRRQPDAKLSLNVGISVNGSVGRNDRNCVSALRKVFSSTGRQE
jgi:hypothetical protein